MTAPSPPVCILLAVYNGEKYLQQQLATIEAQTVPWTMIVADDGSTDGSRSILENFAEQHPGKVRLVSGPRTGRPQDNFFALVNLLGTEAYVAFCDQDDLWRSDKLEILRRECIGLENRVGVDRPCLVYSDLAVVDQDDNIVADSFWTQTRVSPSKVTLGSLLVENVSPGCAMLVNAAMISKFKEFRGDLHCALMHDWWLMLMAQAFGVPLHVDERLVRYRQHSANAAGSADRAGFAHIRRKALQSRSHETARTSRQAALFAEAYRNDLSQRDLRRVLAMATVSTRPKIVRLCSYVRHGLLKQGLPRRLFQFMKM